MKDRAALKAPFALVEIDPARRIVAVNELFLEWAAVPRSEVIGRTVAKTLQLDSSQVASALATVGAGSSNILTRTDAAAGPSQVIVSSTTLDDGHRLVGFVDAVRQQRSEDVLRSSHYASDRESRRLALLLDAAVAFANATSEEELSELLANAVRAAFEGSHASVHLPRDGRFARTGGVNPLEEHWPADAPRPGLRTLSAGRVITVTTPAEADAVIPGVSAAFAAAGIHAAIGAPISDHGRPLGTVACFFAHERTFDDQAAPLITALAQQSAAVFTRIAMERDFRRKAMLDDITGLPDRRLFELELDRSGRWATPGNAVLFIDLDGFKHVNDELGHSAGDALLAEVATRLRTIHRAQDAVARYGGDEFIVHIDGVDRDAAAVVAERVRAAVAAPYPGLPPRLAITASIGVALRTPDESTIDQVIRRADLAMYSAKDAGGDAVVFA